jgi:L-rhamnose isomerase
VQADYENARIFHELLRGDVLFNADPARNWSYALDQMARTERRIPSILKSVDALTRSLAKAALFDPAAISGPQASRDLIAANRAYFGDFDPFGDFDLLFGAAKLNLKIIDLPVRYRARTYGTTNIRRWRHGWLLLKMLVFAARRIKFI